MPDGRVCPSYDVIIEGETRDGAPLGVKKQGL